MSAPGQHFDHAGAGSLNVNQGSGTQNNSSIAGGSHHQQYNAQHMRIENHAPVERAESPLLPCAILPFRRDPDYVPSPAVSDQLREKLSIPGARVALVGIGGVGKSLLAIEHANQVRERSEETWVFWLHASNATRFRQSIQHVVDQLRIPSRGASGQNVFALFESWLRDRKQGPWVLIIDNADDTDFLHQLPSMTDNVTDDPSPGSDRRTCLDYLPNDTGVILFTSRNQKAATTLVDFSDIIEIGQMDEEQAVLLLERKLGVSDDREVSLELVHALDFIPLAITQAAAYIQQRRPRVSKRSFLESLRQSEASEMSLLNRDHGNLRRDKDASNSIILTWQVSFEHIRATHPSAADLLSLMSICDRQAIPDVLLKMPRKMHSLREQKRRQSDVYEWQRGISPAKETHLTVSEEEEFEDIGKFEEAAEFEDNIAMLRGYSFIHATTDPATFEMHRLVQRATQVWLKSRDELAVWQEHFVLSLNSVFPPSDHFETGPTCERLIPHLDSAMTLQLATRDAEVDRADLADKAARYHIRRFRLKRAEDLSTASVDATRTHLGRNHHRTVQHMQTLRAVYVMQKRLKEADALLVDIFRLHQTTPDRHWPTFVGSLLDFAKISHRQGRWMEAERILVGLLDLQNRMPEHADPYGLVMHALSEVYLAQGRGVEAEKLLLKRVQTQKISLGEEHQATLQSECELAGMYTGQGRSQEAEQLYQHILKSQKRVLGEHHQDTLFTASQLAHVYFSQGRWTESEQLCEDAIQAQTNDIEVAHPGAMSSLTTLAATRMKQGRLEEAERLVQRAFEAAKRVHGAENPKTLLFMQILGTNKMMRNPDLSSLFLLDECAMLSSRVRGWSHPKTCQLRDQVEDGIRDLAVRGHVEAAAEKDKLLHLDRNIASVKENCTVHSQSQSNTAGASDGS